MSLLEDTGQGVQKYSLTQLRRSMSLPIYVITLQEYYAAMWDKVATKD